MCKMEKEKEKKNSLQKRKKKKKVAWLKKKYKFVAKKTKKTVFVFCLCLFSFRLSKIIVSILQDTLERFSHLTPMNIQLLHHLLSLRVELGPRRISQRIISRKALFQSAPGAIVHAATEIFPREGHILYSFVGFF